MQILHGILPRWKWGESDQPLEFFVVISIFLNELKDKRIWETKSNNHKEGWGGGGVVGGLVITYKTLQNKNMKQFCNFKENLSKTKVLRYLKVMISKFCQARHLILFFMRTFPAPELFELSIGSGVSQRNALPVYTKPALYLAGQFFLKMFGRGGMSEWWGGGGFKGGIYHEWCQVLR